jgi:sortase A
MATLAEADPTAGGARVPYARPPLGKTRRTIREIGLAMVTGGIVVLAFAAYQLFGTTLAEQKAQTRLQHSFAAAMAQSAKATSPTSSPTTTSRSGSNGSGRAKGSGGSKGKGGHSGRPAGGGGAASGDKPTVGSAGSISPSAPPGTALDHLVIPEIGVNKYVVQGTGPSDLAEGPGHYIGTPLPGQRGNAAIAGHRTTYGAPFYRLNKLSIGARIYLTATSGRIYVYRVVATKVVSPSDVTVLDPTKNAVLTLTTCNPPFSATSRLVVVADLLGRPLAATATTPATTSPTTAPADTSPAGTSPTGTSPAGTTAGPTTPVATSPAGTTAVATTGVNLGTGNSDGWPPALAYGLAFVGLWIGTRLAINRTRRWARLGVVVVGILVCAVPLWFCFENVVRLLPANI